MVTGNPLFSLDGRIALVTGASRGLGLAMAEGLAEAGDGRVGVAALGFDSRKGVVEAGHVRRRLDRGGREVVRRVQLRRPALQQ